MPNREVPIQELTTDQAVATESPQRPAPGRRAARAPSVLRGAWLALGMVVSVVIVALLALWDEAREASAELQNLAAAQSMLASVAGAGLATQLAAVRRDAEAVAAEDSLGRALAPSIVDGYELLRMRRSDASAPDIPVTDPNVVSFSLPFSGGRYVDVRVRIRRLAPGTAWLDRTSIVLLSLPNDPRLRRMDGVVLHAPPLEHAIAESRSWCSLNRAEAAAIGLPARMAMAGVAIVHAGDLGDWGVVVATSARRERDRQSHARWRLILGVLLVSGLVVGFGGVALRTQHKEIELARALSVVEVQRARDEQLARESRAAMMVTLAAGVAHEISTPLNVIAGRAEQLEGRSADERSRHAAQVITQQAGRISDVIRGFLRLARGDVPSLERVDPRAVGQAAVDLVQHRFDNAGVSLEYRDRDNLPNARGDARLLEQALINLLLNACDACPPGGHVELHIDADDETIRFSVLDDGTGISPADAARAVEPFFTTKPMDKGTGLGLAIANEIVAIHRGTLTLAPRSPRGTEAAFQVPIEQRGVDD